MAVWSTHILNARGQLDPFHGHIRDGLSSAEARAVELHPPVSLDVTVRAADFPMMPELYISGSSFGPGRIDVVIDSSQSKTGKQLRAALAKTIYHEFHHVLRWDGPGYGSSLGEALVTEGLAQHFLHQAMECEPEPWENALSLGELRGYAALAAKDFDDTAYSHSEWFFPKVKSLCGWVILWGCALSATTSLPTQILHRFRWHTNRPNHFAHSWNA